MPDEPVGIWVVLVSGRGPEVPSAEVGRAGSVVLGVDDVGAAVVAVGAGDVGVSSPSVGRAEGRAPELAEAPVSLADGGPESIGSDAGQARLGTSSSSSSATGG